MITTPGSTASFGKWPWNHSSVAGDVLGGGALDAGFHLADPVEQQHRPAVRQQLARIWSWVSPETTGSGGGLRLGERHPWARRAGLTSSASRDTEPKTAISLSYSATPNSASMAT